jgi:ribosomal protein L12E/L44/L45/RPP1/RPP2
MSAAFSCRMQMLQPLIWSHYIFKFTGYIFPFFLIFLEIKDTNRKKARAKELEGIDMSNIVSSTRRRASISFAAPPPPKPKIPVETSGKDTKGSDNDNDDEGNDNEEDEEDEEEEEEDSSDDDGSESEEFNEGKSI